MNKLLRGDGWTWVRLSGVIDEDNRLNELLDALRGSLLVLDLAQVERISTVGLRDWLTWLRQAGEGREVVLLDCSPAAVGQLNLVSGFAGGAQVVSVRAPFYCEACDLEQVTVVPMADLMARRDVNAFAVCDLCGGPVVFDDIESTWFAFAASVPIAAITPELAVAVASVRSQLEEPLPLAGLPVEPPPRKPVLSASAALYAPTSPVSEPDPTPRVLSGWDKGFYVAVGVLLGILALLVIQLVTH